MKPIKRGDLDQAVTSMFRTADRNNDGLVMLEELRFVIEQRRETRIRERFKRIDLDRNGSVSAAEFLTWQRGMGSLASSEHQAVADIGGPVPEAINPDLNDDERGKALSRVIEPLGTMTIVNANVNSDAGTSLDELVAYERKRFDGADSNRDGELTMQELRNLDPERGRLGPGEPGFLAGRLGRPPGKD